MSMVGRRQVKGRIFCISLIFTPMTSSFLFVRGWVGRGGGGKYKCRDGVRLTRHWKTQLQCLLILWVVLCRNWSQNDVIIQIVSLVFTSKINLLK